MESGDFDSAKALYERECTDWWPISEFDAHRSNCIHAAEARDAALRAQQEAQRRQQLKTKVEALLASGKYSEAHRLHGDQCQVWWPLKEYEVLKRGAMYAQRFLDVYRNSNLADLDVFFKKLKWTPDLRQ